MTAKSSEKPHPEGDLATPRGPKQAPSPQLLFRNVPTAYFQNGTLIDTAFRLRDRDRGLMSVSLESKTSAPAAYELRLKHTGKHSAGLWAVSVEECSAGGLDVYSDPASPPEDKWEDPAHGGIDFRHLAADKKVRGLYEKHLFDAATHRGPVYQPTLTVAGGAAKPEE